MTKKNHDKTYYLLDEFKVAHICSDRLTLCGLDAKSFSEATDMDLINRATCKECLLISKTKKATFEVKAQLVQEPAKGKII